MNQPFQDSNGFADEELRLLRKEMECGQPPADLRDRVLASYDKLMIERRRRQNLRRVILAAAGVTVLSGVSYLILNVMQSPRHALPETAMTVQPQPIPAPTYLPAPTPSPLAKGEPPPSKPDTRRTLPPPPLRLRGEATPASASQWVLSSTVLTVDGEFYPLPDLKGGGKVLWVTTKSGLVLFDGRKSSPEGQPVDIAPERITFSTEGHFISLVGTFSLPTGGARGIFLAGDFVPGQAGLAESPTTARAAATKGEKP